MMTFNIDTSDLDIKLDRISKINKKRIHEGIGIIIESHVVRKIDEMGLVDTGAFKGSISHKTKTDHVLIHDGVDYGVHPEYGTRPHVIRAKNKKALHWKKDGKDFFAYSVNHPGTKEYAPFRKGLIASQDDVTAFVRKSIINCMNTGG